MHNTQKILNIYRKDNRKYAHCECIICGRAKDVRASDLYSTRVSSCACKMIKHGLFKSKIYSVYNNMKDRCLNPNCHAYKNYGGRGIAICNEWLGENGFSNFNRWAADAGYKEGLSIDRENIDGNYEPTNCRWITLGENVALSNIQHPRK